MPGLVLHDDPRSSNPLTVRFLLAELDLPHERRTVDLSPLPSLSAPRDALVGRPSFLAAGPVG